MKKPANRRSPQDVWKSLLEGWHLEDLADRAWKKPAIVDATTLSDLLRVYARGKPNQRPELLSAIDPYADNDTLQSQLLALGERAGQAADGLTPDDCRNIFVMGGPETLKTNSWKTKDPICNWFYVWPQKLRDDFSAWMADPAFRDQRVACLRESHEKNFGIAKAQYEALAQWGGKESLALIQTLAGGALEAMDAREAAAGPNTAAIDLPLARHATLDFLIPFWEIAMTLGAESGHPALETLFQALDRDRRHLMVEGMLDDWAATHTRIMRWDQAPGLAERQPFFAGSEGAVDPILERLAKDALINDRLSTAFAFNEAVARAFTATPEIMEKARATIEKWPVILTTMPLDVRLEWTLPDGARRPKVRM